MQFPLVTRSTFNEQRQRIAELQNAVEGLLIEVEESKSYTGNPYSSYRSQVLELSRKFLGLATWGNHIAGNVIQVRSTFTVGGGIRPVAIGDNADREIAFVQEFIRRNNIDEDIPQDWCVESNIEGKALVRLYVEGGKNISARLIPWTDNEYEIETVEGDYSTFESVTYRPGNKGDRITLPEDEFVYRRFGGRIHSVNKTPPICGSVLRHMEATDKALVDWRKLNHLFAAPTPVVIRQPNFKGSTILPTDSDGEVNWKLGKLLELPNGADFKLESMAAAAFESLKEEIVTNSQIVSGRTGVPVHFFGFPELLSNRNTATSLVELVIASTQRDRDTWKSAYQELFQKAISLANEHGQAGLDPAKIGAELPVISDARIEQLERVWLPLYLSGAISLETFLSKVPDVDPKQEQDRLEGQQTRRTDEILREIESEVARAEAPR